MPLPVTDSIWRRRAAGMQLWKEQEVEKSEAFG